MTQPGEARLPWEIVETLPFSDAALIDHWIDLLQSAATPHDRARALVGSALSTYWATQTGASTDGWDTLAARRREQCDEAIAIARTSGDTDLTAIALLGWLSATWGPDSLRERPPITSELSALVDEVTDVDIALRIREWIVLGHLEVGDLDAAVRQIDLFETTSQSALRASGDHAYGEGLALRRTQLWRSNVAMLSGQIDDALAQNQAAITETASTAGAPFSFQNVAITLAIEKYLTRRLDDVIEPIRSIRASSPRVALNWDVGLAFALSETGDLDGVRAIFEPLAAADFDDVPRDLNWLVTMHLLGLVAARLEHASCHDLARRLEPFAHLDAVHGAGYASYGPVGRVVGLLQAVSGDLDAAGSTFEHVLSTRSPGPWTSLTSLARAQALHSVDPERARTDAMRAAAEFGSMELAAWSEVAATTGRSIVVRDRPTATRERDTWTLRHPDGCAQTPASKGIDHLIALLASPGRAIAAIDLDTTIDRSIAAHTTVEQRIDEQARTEYRERVEVLLRSPAPLSERDQHELDELRRQLAGARFTTAAPELERARVRVTKAIRRAIQAIAATSPGLGRHLELSISTGARCMYAPPSGTAWEIHR